ncbi:MAG TPA: amino acid ABC transporter permease [candidate division Zixibacteria bacterium]|nr:amino acid ABC transporter permease [candidate division Zixibacteria bacterium]
MSDDQPAVKDNQGASRIAPSLENMNEWPWWLIIAVFLGLLITFLIINNEDWSKAFLFVIKGLRVTLTIAIVGYLIAIFVGLFIGLGRVSGTSSLLGVIYYNFATFYVEIVRGIPMLVIIMYVAFVGVPLVAQGINFIGEWLLSIGITGIGTGLAEVTVRNFSNSARVTLALGMAYGAFEAEVFRAGIESIEKGQMEAARSLGMSYGQSMRYIILPQAVRRVLPALGNDFVAIVKDSSLASILGVQDLTQMTRLRVAGTFLAFQTWSILAFIYLLITVSLTRIVRYIERRYKAA